MPQEGVHICPFEQLSLSSSDTTQLQLVVKTILDANLCRYERFLDSDNGKVNSSFWKLVKTTHRTRVYLERQYRPSFTPFQGNSSSVSNNSKLQSLLCVGSTSGALDDVMLRIVNPPPSTVNDLSAATLLSTITLPTTVNPFQSVELLSGERLGYHLLHSIGIPMARHLPYCVRSQLSVCSFFRQESKTSVSVYTLGVMESMDDRAQRPVVPHFVNTLLSTFKRTPSVNSRLSLEPKTLAKRDSVLQRRASMSRDKCVTCSKRPWQLGRIATCNVCSKSVCNSCKIVEELGFMTPELDMTKRGVIFCSSCADDENVSEFPFAETSSCTSSWGTAHDRDLSPSRM
ncbi:hypothetical protein GN244_ATG03560 [Phytophthora infestans]|uniref:FYVE-type domain-containing protein n=1 Tax=Phytophthora infestans TaxID=4787 RepID=A0A833WNP5_PHYIN|nr:hypothetical protein GN244_ATG03560 [Phytophthora infestans]